MKHFLKNNVLFWLPRIFGIFLIVFLGIFALDVFVPGESWWYILAALLIHLVPNYILLIALVVAWKNDLYGGVVYLLLGIGSIIFLKTYTFLPSFFILSFPILLLGVLFLWSYFLNKKQLQI